jgi:hypothetical protein
VTEITERMTRLSEYASGNLGRPAMKPLLIGIAFAMAIFVTSQAFAMPACSWAHYECGNVESK